jgi:guanylate kinase
MTDNDKPSSISSPEQPDERVPRGRLFVFAGPSGVGKDTLIRELIGRWPFYLSISATTRPPRPGEVDGLDYVFLTDEEFTTWVEEGRFLEWARFAEHRYGTPRAAVEEQLEAGVDVLVEIEVQGAMQVKAIAPDATFIFVEPPSLEELQARLERRGDTGDMEARLERARVEMEMADEFDHRVVNEVLSDAVAGLLSVVARSEGSQNDQPAD